LEVDDMVVTVSSRGQTVIPSRLRKRYGIVPNSKVEFIDTGKEIVVVPLPKDVLKASYGILKEVSTHDLIRARRKERLREQGKRG
jgi:AbrB family looped-hinge helix DNA binding protein